MSQKDEQQPIQQSVHVDCPIEDAFRLFTEGFAEWWPLAAYSVSGDEAASCEIEPWTGGRVLERTRSGEERDWGSVAEWSPPNHVKLAWYPGEPGDCRQTVDVDFQVEADGTRVTVIHTGWEVPGVAVSQLRTHYTAQWSAFLACFSWQFAYREALATA